MKWGDNARDFDTVLAVWPNYRPLFDNWLMQELDDRFHETCVMELMVWLRIPRLRLAKRGARSWQDGGG